MGFHLQALNEERQADEESDKNMQEETKDCIEDIFDLNTNPNVIVNEGIL